MFCASIPSDLFLTMEILSLIRSSFGEGGLCSKVFVGFLAEASLSHPTQWSEFILHFGTSARNA